MTDLADREWRLIREEARPGPTNMALDEIAAETAAAGGPRTLRVYRWEPSTLSLGYHQDPDTIDWDFCEREGITVTRRQTGGGAIYHDFHGDISYSTVAPADELPGDLMDTYDLLCEPLIDALEGISLSAGFAAESQPAIHQPACYLREVHPAHDVVAGDGRKLSGNAQHRRKDSIVQHGSLTFERRTERHLAVFADHDVTPADFESRVTSVSEQVDCSRTAVVDAIEAAFADWADAEEGSWTDAELERARERADRKYAADTWVRHREDPT
jgi:lipoate-protein ligase A